MVTIGPLDEVAEAIEEAGGLGDEAPQHSANLCLVHRRGITMRRARALRSLLLGGTKRCRASSISKRLVVSCSGARQPLG
jgi:hypothetical protein